MSGAERGDIDPGSPRLVRSLDGVDNSGGGRFQRRYAAPCIGHRHGTLVVTGYLLGRGGGVKSLVVQCDCGGPEHAVSQYNLAAGRTSRCNTCAKRQAADTRTKKFIHYAGACPDLEHRRRLLNRISAIHTRCYSPNNKQWRAYGGRGITCWWVEQYGDERIGGRSRTGRQHTLRWRYDMLAYLCTLPGWDNPKLELDREDNDKGYDPGNLRFIGRSGNLCNRRNVDDLSTRIRDLEAELARLRSG